MYYSPIPTTHVKWWRRSRLRLTILYVIIAIILLAISITGQLRILKDIGKTFGGFFWALDTDNRVIIVSTLPQTSSFVTYTSSLTNSDHIVAVVVTGKGRPVFSWQQAQAQATVPLMQAYQHAQPGDNITYTMQHADNSREQFLLPAVQFTWDMWWQSYGLAFLAGVAWLLTGIILLVTAQEWTGAVEGMTLLPPSMLFLAYSFLGNVQTTYSEHFIIQLLWVPSFALLGAAFIHLSLTYRPEAVRGSRRPRMIIDGLPYLPLIALVAFEWSSFLLFGTVAGRINLSISLGYAVFGGTLSFVIGVLSLLRISGLLPGSSIPARIRRRLGDLLTLWIGSIGLGFCFGILPILLLGHPLVPFQIFLVLAILYPVVLGYAIHSLRLINRLEITLQQREEALGEQQKTALELQATNHELQQATSLLLHADAHLRSVLSQRIHDQPKQQALRIRSLLGHWQHKLKVEAEHDTTGKVASQPIIEALGKVRGISEELESDLRGLQLLVEDTYQRRSLGLKLHLEKLLREDLPALHPESPLKVQPDLWALDALSHDLEQTEEGVKIAEAISYTVTQALLNVYNHAGASFAAVRTTCRNGKIEVSIRDDGRGFDPATVSPEKTSLLKARLKAREAGCKISISSVQRPWVEHGTKIVLTLPMPPDQAGFLSGS